jgi:prophage DNA circulation protein
MADACYVPKYLPASFKGVPFEAMEVNSQHGRRGAEGEFVFSENTAYADLGRRIRTYSVQGRFASSDHIALAAALIAVCELPGPGLLLHPTRGPITVACQQLRVRDNPLEEAGVTYFDMDMVEANLWPNGLQTLGNLLGLAIAPLVAALDTKFEQEYTPDDVAFYDSNAVIGTAQTAVNSIRDAYQEATQGQQNVKIWRSLAAFDALSTDRQQLSNEETLFGAIRDGMALVDKYGVGDQKIRLFRRIINQNSDPIVVGSSGRSSVNAVQTTMRTLGAAYMARAALEVSPTDMDQAFRQYDNIVLVFEEEITIALNMCDTRLHYQLSQYFEQVKTQLLHRAYNVPAVVEYTFPSTVNSLVAAYQIWSDGTRFREIEQRNPSGWPWEVGPKIIAPGV